MIDLNCACSNFDERTILVLIATTDQAAQLRFPSWSFEPDRLLVLVEIELGYYFKASTTDSRDLKRSGELYLESVT